LGASDRPYFGWLVEALDRFEREQGRLAALGREGRGLDLWGLAEQQATPAIERLREGLGAPRTAVTLFDRFPSAPTVRPLDLNHLEALPDAACDVVTLFRASYLVADPPSFLGHLRRILRPGGLAVVDWVHGCSDAPVLDFPLDAGYGGLPSPYVTTYLDPHFLAELPGEFEAFIRHVNRPPGRANVDRPGVAVPAAERLRRLLRGGPRRRLSLATYADALRGDLARAGKWLVEPSLLEPHFKVAFRSARYLYRETRRFNLYLLTVLQPVGG